MSQIVRMRVFPRQRFNDRPLAKCRHDITRGLSPYRSLYGPEEFVSGRIQLHKIDRNRPVSTGRHHDLALRVDKQALSEDADRAEASVTNGPPLKSISGP